MSAKRILLGAFLLFGCSEEEPCKNEAPAITIEISANSAIAMAVKSMSVEIVVGDDHWQRTFNLSDQLVDGSTSVGAEIVPAPSSEFTATVSVFAYDSADLGGNRIAQQTTDLTAHPDACNRLPLALDPIQVEEGRATLSQRQLDFGRVVVGSTVTMTFELFNDSNADAVVTTGTIAGSSTFTLIEGTPGAQTLRPNQRMTLRVQFIPRGGVEDATLPFSLCEEGCDATVSLRGIGLAQAITCLPQVIDFGFVNPGACLMEEIRCENQSSQPATLASWRFSRPVSAFSLSATVSVALAANEVLRTSAAFCPSTTGPSEAILVIEEENPIASLDKAVILIGTGGGPDIRCAPVGIDLGIVGVGDQIEASASCENVGDQPLLINDLTLAGSPPGFSMTPAVSTPVTLARSEVLEITVTFQPQTAGAQTTRLDIASNDRDTPTSSITVSAEAIAAGCTLAQDYPALLEFGAVAPHASLDAKVYFRNIGTGPCGVLVRNVSPIPFTLVEPVGTAVFDPGEIEAVTVRLSPVADGHEAGLLMLQTTDPQAATISIDLDGNALSPYGRTHVAPDPFNFGRVGIDCVNGITKTLRISNHATSRWTVFAEMDGSPSVFDIATSTIAFRVNAGNKLDIAVGFHPTEAKDYEGRIRVTANGQAQFINVTGTGVAGLSSDNTIRFEADTATQVTDILFMVDDSCSMAPPSGEAQTRMIAAAPIFLSRGDRAGAEYHIGVTAADMTQNRGGVLRGSPNVVTWDSTSRVADLVTNLDLGVGGSGVEAGLQSARRGVTDSSVVNGANAGFLRPNAKLVAIMFSDEEDQSADSVANNLSAMAMRPIGVPGSVQIFTITAGRSACSSPGLSGDATPRYLSAAAQTGGFNRSICADPYNDIIADLAEGVFGRLDETFGLGARPAPGSVAVRVDGVPVTDFGVDYTNRKVVFFDGKIPTSTNTIEIDYLSVCVPATCGDGNPDPGEECDDGDHNNWDICTNDCYAQHCGDGRRTGAEECDDGNTIPGDGCSPACLSEP